jgi:hypothetical protein
MVLFTTVTHAQCNMEASINFTMLNIQTVFHAQTNKMKPGKYTQAVENGRELEQVPESKLSWQKLKYKLAQCYAHRVFAIKVKLSGYNNNQSQAAMRAACEVLSPDDR